MTIQLDAKLEAALTEAAQRLGCPPEILAIQVLRERFPAKVPPIVPRDDWERDILSIGKPIGANLSNEALSSEGLYD